MSIIVPKEVKEACDNLLIARSLTSHPKKFAFAARMGFEAQDWFGVLDQVHTWMGDVHAKFESLVARMEVVDQVDPEIE